MVVADRYRYVLEGAQGLTLDFETGTSVFVPTQTSQLLIEGARRSITTPGTLLDLGCGIGICGLTLAKLGLCRMPVYCSDFSESAVRLTAKNADSLNVQSVVRRGSLLTPWEGMRFDAILRRIWNMRGRGESVSVVSGSGLSVRARWYDSGRRRHQTSAASSEARRAAPVPVALVVT